MKVPLSRPDITQKEIDEVVAVLKSPHLSMGPKQYEFQERFADYIGVRYAEAISSGTGALHLVMKSFGIGKGDEVITSPYSFIASSNSVLFTQATPVFVDIDPNTLNIDSSKIEERITPRTKAILAVHVFGMPADMIEINKIAKKHKLIVIEDACEAIGAEINGKRVGNFSDAAVFAFYPNKQITTGEGGMVTTNKKDIAEMCRSLKNQGRARIRKEIAFSNLGYNYRISDINCALGIVQLKRINEILGKREKVAEVYNKELEGVDALEPLCKREGFKRSWFVYVVRLSKNFSRHDRDRIVAGLISKGIECGKYFPAIHLEPFYRDMFGFGRGDYTVAEGVSDRTFAIPFYNRLKEKDIRFVCNALKEVLRRRQC